MLKKIYQWIIYSSANPDKYSASIKGFGFFAAPYIVNGLSGIFGVDVDQSLILMSVEVISSLAGLFLMAFGLTRKLVMAWKAWSLKK